MEWHLSEILKWCFNTRHCQCRQSADVDKTSFLVSAQCCPTRVNPSRRRQDKLLAVRPALSHYCWDADSGQYLLVEGPSTHVHSSWLPALIGCDRAPSQTSCVCSSPRGSSCRYVLKVRSRSRLRRTGRDRLPTWRQCRWASSKLRRL